MPLITVTLTKGQPQEFINKVSKSITAALIESYYLPPNDIFQRFLQMESGSFIYDANYGGGPRSDNFMIIEIKTDARRRDEKEQCFKAVVKHLSDSAGVRAEDVMIILDADSNYEDYSFANGVSRADTDAFSLLAT